MKNLVLLRHAKSSWDYDVADRNRPLAKKGIHCIQAIAKVCESTFTSVQQYYSSPANRALHTATILFHELQLPMKRLQLDEALYTFEASGILTAIDRLPDELDSVCFVGHNPALTYVAAKLTDNLIQHMPTAAWVKIIFAQDNWKSLSSGTAKWGHPKVLLAK